ncbi:uncharacterized protein mthl15 isoform X3 [Drosophila kikkawai]|uniref:Uncharacterized protein mthl15 isoform X3 n=1 Tax=Drosophila kikkawai TaxID=30033 RepID=A0A6P4I9Y3_DROKI|nr:uncharacterized protein LOC108077054 isoform X3 [Drosophila kikkawai]
MINGLTLVFLILSGIISKGCAVRICCSPNSILFKYRDATNSDIYQCASNGTLNLKEFPVPIEVIGEMIAPQGLGLEGPEPPHNDSDNLLYELPKCKSATILNVTEQSENSLYLRNDSCVGQLDKRKLIVLSCDFKKNVLSQSVKYVNKCCPLGSIYVSENNTCIVLGEPDFFVYSSIINNPIIFFDNYSLQCSDNQAFVEYTVSAKIVQFSESSLVWKDGSNSLPFSKFCIDAIYDGYEIPSKERYSSHQKYLVQACQDRKICQRLPCIRRCCGEGEMYAKGNSSTYCKSDETDIEFQGFQNLNINANFSKPAEFGILHRLQCQKFRLDPDNFPDDAHTINSSDGSLIIQNTRKRYTNTQYCLERVRPNQKSSCTHSSVSTQR